MRWGLSWLCTDECLYLHCYSHNIHLLFHFPAVSVIIRDFQTKCIIQHNLVGWLSVLIISLHTFKWLQVFLSNTNSSICSQLNGFTYCYVTPTIQFGIIHLSNSSIWPIEGTLTGTTTLDQSEPGNNGNEEVLHIPQNFRTEASPIRWFSLMPRTLIGRGVLSFCRDVVDVFYSPSQLSCLTMWTATNFTFLTSKLYMLACYSNCTFIRELNVQWFTLHVGLESPSWHMQQ